MRRNIIVGFSLLFALFLTGCDKKDEAYYRRHPAEIQQALENCSEQSANTLSCTDLRAVQESMNQIAVALSIDPQGFGKQILVLQEKIALLQANLKQNPKEETVQELKAEQTLLASYLAMIQWKEAPES